MPYGARSCWDRRVSPRTVEEDLLRDALGLEGASTVSLRSREPFGAGSVAGFDVSTPDGGLTYFVDTSRRPVARETGLATGTPGQPGERVWLHPADPHLPALAAAAFGHSVRALLARLGLHDASSPSIVAYRPGRRAVLKVSVDGAFVWVKVVPPSRVERIAGLHRDLAAAGIPVPAVRAWSEEGLLVLEQAPGLSVPDVLGDEDAPLDPASLLDEVDELRARFAAVPLTRAARTGDARRRSWYADRLRAVLDAHDRSLMEHAVARADAAHDPTDEARSIHGDLHFGQLFVDDARRVCSVIDVDTAGVGDPVDDSGAFVAHALASALLTPAPRDTRVRSLGVEAFARWNDGRDAPAFRARAATHLLGHALGAAEAGDAAHARTLLDTAVAIVDDDVDRLRGT